MRGSVALVDGTEVDVSSLKLASIGPVTSAALRAAGLEPTVEAERHTIDGLVEAMLRIAGSR